MRRQLALASLVVLALVGLTTPARAAAPLDNTRYSGQESFTDCGFDGLDTYWGTTQILDTNPSLSGQFFRFTDRYNFRDTLTNPANGRYVVISASGVFKELQPKTTDGRVFTYITHDSGRFTIKNSAGRVLVQESGVLTFSYVFDTLGDGAPGGIGSDGILVRVSGPHPTFAPDFDFCGLVRSAIG